MENEFAPTISVVGLQAKCEEIIAFRAQTDAAEKIYKDSYHRCEKLEEELIGLLEELGMKNFAHGGFSFIRTERKSLTTPKGDEFIQFCEFLKEKGHYESLISVNSRTLLSWYLKEDELARSRGEPYAMIPGLTIPTIIPTLSVRKAK